ncbi:MAG: hypothetical protein PHG38_10135 [Bacteroidales bacterium]|jgi:TATA-binding protein-associated factor Taf7|nr:hypothetical protein [Bacteroidales bacterium]
MFSQKIMRENPDKDIVYFRNAYENAVMRHVKGEGIYIKFKGEKEFYAHINNGVVADAIIESTVDYIDKETYDNW